MTFKLKLACFAVAVALAAPAMAQVYVGGSAGGSDYGSCDGALSCDSSAFAFKLFGGYQFNPYVGIEADYIYFGKATADLGFASGNVKTQGVAAFLTGTLPLDQFELFGKVGGSYLKTKVNASVPLLGSASDSEGGFEFAWGVGAGYNFTPNWGVRAEWEQYKAKFGGEGQTIDLWSLGVRYRF